MCIFEYISDNYSCSLKIIYVTIWLSNILYPMFEEKFANNFEMMVLLKGNSNIFALLNLPIRLFVDMIL